MVKISGYQYTVRDGKRKAAHILIAEEIAGRELKPDEVVHHINGDKGDNSPDNLQIMTRSEHARHHASERGRKGFSPETLQRQSERHIGKKSAHRKLTEEQIFEIARLLMETEMSFREIGERFNVSYATIEHIREGRIYRDVLEKIPNVRIPLREKKEDLYGGKKNQRFSIAEINTIRLAILSGRSVHSIAKEMGVSPQTIANIRDNVTYTEIPWPVETERYYGSSDMPSLLNWILSHPMTEQEDDARALKEDYHLIPNLPAITVLRMVRRALAGDVWLGCYLLLSSCYAKTVENIVRENSILSLVLGGET